MSDNALGSVLKPIVSAAASAVIGPLGLVFTPTLGALCTWASEKLGSESEAAKAAAESLSHLFGHLSGDAAREVLSSIGKRHNCDLERATAIAIHNALTEAQCRNVAQHLQLADTFEKWFSVWHSRINRALKSDESTASLFYSDNPVDPVQLATTAESEWWPAFRPVLLRWAWEEKQFIGSSEEKVDSPILPEALDAILGNQLLELTRSALRELLREETHRRGLIAWQQRFFEELARQTQASDKGLSQTLEVLAVQGDDLNHFLTRIEAALARIEGDILPKLSEVKDLGSWDRYVKTLLEFYDAPPSPAYAYARIPEAVSIRCTLDGVSMDLIPLLIRRFTAGTRSKPLILLGEYGQGKTAACGALGANLANRFLSDTSANPIPLIVPLCNLRDLHTLDDYIQNCLSNWYGVSADILSFTKARGTGHFMIILDGLDEYLASQPKTDVVFHLRQFALHTTLRQNQFLVASRPNVFGPRDRGDLTRLYDLVDIEWLAVADIYTYLGRLGLQELMEDELAIPMLRQIAVRPLFLTMLSEAVATLGARRAATNQAAFLEYYVDAWHEREEREKGHERGALTKDEVLSVLGHVAASMNVRNSDTITTRELSLLVEGNLRHHWRLELDHLQTQARDRLLLVPDFGAKTQRLTFRHAYYRSYFSARHLERLIMNGDFASVRGARVEDLTTDLLFQLADGNGELSRALNDGANKLSAVPDWTVDTWSVILSMWAIRSGVTLPPYRLRDLFRSLGKGAGRIVFNLMRSLGLAQLEELEISNMDLSGVVVQKLVLKACRLSAVNMRASSIPNASLDRCTLESCDLRHAWLANASVLRGTECAKSDFSFANMSRCTIKGTYINESSFVRTKMPGISATGVTFNGCNFTATDFRLSRFESCTFSRCRLNGALFIGSLVTSCEFPESDIDLAFGLREAI